MSIYDTLHISWTVECVRNFGYVLPINAIYVGAIGYMLSDEADPLQHSNGMATRGFRMGYDLRELAYEPTSVN